jgi:TonB-linked SusC/RagA family outer membrane protein
MALLVGMLPAMAQQTRKVSGKVVDTNTGEALIGVKVLIKGTTRGTVTDFNGSFSIDIPNTENEILTFSYIGYEETEEKVKNSSTLTVKMGEATKQMDEVVVVGYGVQKKQSVIGSISSIDNKTLKTTPVTNISQAMAGKLAGIQVVQSSGEVGGDVADIYVRGMGTWNNATPLFVVDGIIRAEFAKIDPNEIQTINVLKDASATAVFGVKGGNGVIIITTKRGALGKPKISVTAQTAITQPMNIPQPLGAYDAMSLRYLADYGQFSTRTPQTKGGTLAYDLLLWRTGASPWTHPDVRWVDNVLKKQSTMQQYNLNISGGTKTVRYFVSGGFLNQNGFYKNDDLTKYSRFNFRSNLDVDVTKNLTASLSVGARVENMNSPTRTIWSSWDVYRAAFAYTGRAYPIYNPDGSYAGTGNNIVKGLKEASLYRDVMSTLESSLSVNYKLDFIAKGLSAKGQVSFDTQGEVGQSWSKSTAEYVYDLASDTYQKFGEDRPLSFGGVQKNNNWRKFYYEASINYSNSFGKNTVTGLFLGNRNELIRNGEVAFADQGIVGRATYDFDKRYFGEFNIGINGSENFKKGNRYGVFPAFSLGWMVTNEGFLTNSKLVNILTNLKIRASLGWVGNDKFTDPSSNQPVRFMYVQDFSNGGGYTFGTGDNYFGGIQQGDIANPWAQWEVVRKQNIGFESEFFKGLFAINFDYFYEFRNKIFAGIGAVKPDYVGANFKPANVGETENQGIEIELKHKLRISKDFDYYINANFTYNRNKVLKKADPLGLLPYRKEEGYPIGTPLMWKNIGYFGSYEEIQNSPSQLVNNNGIPGNLEIIPGDLKFEDFNHDGVINDADSYRQGYGTVPELQYGVTIGGNWKSFDFSALLQGSAHALFMKQWEIMWAFSNNDNVFQKHNYYWAPEIANEAQFTRFYGKSWINNERYYSTYEAGSGTYLRLKTVELGYTLPAFLIKRAGISSVRVYLSSNNLYMWSVEKYLDPDNRDTRGGKMPQTRAFNIGLNVNF